jgi:hypothetical protein
MPAVERSDAAVGPRKSSSIPTGCQHAPGASLHTRMLAHPARTQREEVVQLR